MPDGDDMIERRPMGPQPPPDGEGQPPIQQFYGEARSLTAPRSLLAQTVETQLLPEERFKSPIEGQVQEIKKIDEVVGVLSKVGDHYEALFFDGNGNLLRSHLDPSSRDIASQSGKSYIPVNRDTDHTDKFNQLIGKLGFNQPEVQDRIKTLWEKSAKTKISHNLGSEYGFMVEKSKVLSEDEFFIPTGKWDMEIRVNPSTGKKGFVFHSGDAYFHFDPDKPSAKTPLTPQEFASLNDPTSQLQGGLTLNTEAHFFKINDSSGKEVASFSGSKPKVDPNDPSKLYFINTGRIYSLDLNGVVDRTSRPVPESQIRVEDPQEIDVDPNVNFIIIRSEGNKLAIVDKESGDVVREFEGVSGPIMVDQQGDILYVDSQNKLREIQTNFQAIPSGGTEVAQAKREEQLRQMQERFANLELNKVEKSKTGQVTEEDVARTLRESISRQVSEQITTATDPAVIEDVLDRLQGLKADPTNQAYGEVVDEFVTQAREKLSGIRTVEFDGQLTAYQQALDEVKAVGDTIGLDEQFAKLLELRQKIDVTDPQKRREIEQRLRTLQTKKDALNNQYQGELVEAANQTLPQIEQLIRETGSTQELAYFSTSTQVQQFEMMLSNIRDPQLRKELRERYTSIRGEQRTKLEESSNRLAEQDRQRWAQVVEEARDDLTSLREQVEQLSDTREIDRFGRNPLVTAWRAKLFALPPELREIEEKRLEIILGARKKDMEHRRELGAVGEAGELRFGNATFAVYKEPPRIWQPRLNPRKGGFSEWADLTFEDTQGRVFRPDPEHEVLVSTNPDDERSKRLIERHRGEADEYFKGLKRRVPEFDEHWRITDFHMAKLEEVAETLNLQLDNHRGILILQGEAGTGKNVLVDMLSNLSNREVVSILCNENSVKEDLTYEFYYDPEKGTYKLPSKLVEGIQTPGAIILFDEINALKPGIAKMMNSLFDYRRRIFLPEGGKEREIIVDPTVLFVGTMNPQNYGGVNRLSPEVKSRARVVDIDYPPFEEMRGGRTHYKSDEAEMLAAYMDTLGELKQQELKQCWDYVINRDTTNGADRILQGNPAIETDIRRVYDVIRVANRLRDMYSAYQIGDSNEPMDFPTSLREVTDIVMEMNHRQGVKPMIKRVIVPKIDDKRQKRLVEQTVDAVLPS